MIDFLLPLSNSPFDFGCSTLIKRDDLIHPFVSGNKYRKLKYILDFALNSNAKGILTFGGAFSNHIYSSAAYAHLQGLKSVGIIRGEDDLDNPTLQFARSMGMDLYFISRDEYRLKEKSSAIKGIIDAYPEYCIIPEGGDHLLALPGVEEIVDEIKDEGMVPDYIAVASGTGVTAAGILKGIIKHKWNTKLLVLSSLKHKALEKEILLKADAQEYAPQLIYIDEYCGQGYAKVDQPLIDFMHHFYYHTSIPLDPIYTGKLVFGLHQMSLKKIFRPEETLVWVHTGGLQGNAGYNYLLEKKKAKESLRIKF